MNTSKNLGGFKFGQRVLPYEECSPSAQRTIYPERYARENRLHSFVQALTESPNVVKILEDSLNDD